MNNQKIIITDNEYTELDNYFIQNNIKKIFLVCDSSISLLKIGNYFKKLTERIGINIIYFSDFQPNPLYDSVVNGVSLFNSSYCDIIVAVGGGSAIDVAKCIKLYSNMNHSQNYLNQNIIPNDIPFLVVPTTSGTGSEATRYAVIYYNGEKQSISHVSCIPGTVIFDSSVLKTLPVYQKKSTMLDALCHAVEAFWSINSNDESKEYSRTAIKMIVENKNSYIANDDTANFNMLKASNFAGKAINITQTTAGHAMCYKLTSLYNIAHGHAAALCNIMLWPYMLRNTKKCIDVRGESYLCTAFNELGRIFGGKDAEDGCTIFQNIVQEFEMTFPKADEKDYDILTKSVNLLRLKNNPVALDEQSINMLYHQILK